MRPSIAWLLRGALAVLGPLAGIACASETPAPPDQSAPFAGFAIATVAPRSIVALQIEPSDDAKVIWDAGGNEQVLPTGLGGTMFTVPLDTEGTYSVVVENGSGRSQPVTVLVEGDPLMLPYPRIDHVMLLDPEFNADGTVTTTLYVQGANFDIGAVVKIDGMPVATVAHKAILNNLYGVPQSAFEYPIHHYVALSAVPLPLQAGDSVMVTVQNLDGEWRSVSYTVPESEAALDSDGDSLLDTWETTGYDGTNDGLSDTNRYRRDIFVELDIMTGLENHLVPTTTNGIGTVDSIRAMFAAAPFINPYTANGINLVIDVSGTVRPVHTVVFDVAGSAFTPSENGTTEAFSTLKGESFDHAGIRQHATAGGESDGDVYHYAIWAVRMLGEDSGRSDMPELLPPQPGDDFLIGLAALDDVFDSPRSKGEILAHELGHNLGQRHGGATDDRYNPNYLSVMSYAWTLRTGLNAVQRMRHQTCFPFYYGKAGENEVDDGLPASINMIVDYSAGMAAPVIETALSELEGVCSQAVDWDADDEVGEADDKVGETTGGVVDVNRNGTAGETLKDFANWPALQLDGPTKNGTIH